MHTCFASPERAPVEELKQLVEETKRDAILSGLLHLADGLLVILNEHRQVLSVNHTLLDLIGVKNVYDVVGLRPGEMIHCVHAFDNEAGCGTGITCSSCGAAISIVTAQTTNEPAEEKCVVTVDQDGVQVDLCFIVRSKPVEFHGHKLILLYLHDVSSEEKRIALERVFFHDINNILTVLNGVCSYIKLADPSEYDELADMGVQQIERMHGEVTLQKLLMRNCSDELALNVEKLDIGKLFDQLTGAMSRHVLAQEKHIKTEILSEPPDVFTDPLIVERILRNMLLNALEASEPGETVRLSCSTCDERLLLKVWNNAFIPPSIQQRIFQLHFSSKKSAGRGFGAYSMKLLGENVLRGRVYYTTSQTDGTTFILDLPYSSPV